MEENKRVEDTVVEASNIVEIKEKPTLLKRAKTFASEHKRGIIRTGVAVAAGVAGLVVTKLAIKHATDDYEYDDDFEAALDLLEKSEAESVTVIVDDKSTDVTTE